MKLFWNLKLRSFQNRLRVSAVRSRPLGNHMGAVVAAGHQGDLSAPPASSRSELLGATCLAPSGLLEDQLCASLGSFCWITSLSRFKVAMVRVFIGSLWKLTKTIHCPPPASLPLSMYQWPWAPVQLTLLSFELVSIDARFWDFTWWSSGYDSSFQCRGPRFSPWSEN